MIKSVLVDTIKNIVTGKIHCYIVRLHETAGEHEVVSTFKYKTLSGAKKRQNELLKLKAPVIEA